MASKAGIWEGCTTKGHFLTAFQRLRSLQKCLSFPSSPGTIHYLLLKACLVFHSKEINATWHPRTLTDFGTGIFLTRSIQGFTIRGLNDFTYPTLNTDPSKQIPGKGLLGIGARLGIIKKGDGRRPRGNSSTVWLSYHTSELQHREDSC